MTRKILVLILIRSMVDRIENQHAQRGSSFKGCVLGDEKSCVSGWGGMGCCVPLGIPELKGFRRKERERAEEGNRGEQRM